MAIRPMNESMADNDDVLLPFDNDDPAFARGVEVGILYQRLRQEPGPTSAVIHGGNAEMALRLGEALERSVAAVELSADWLEVTYL